MQENITDDRLKSFMETVKELGYLLKYKETLSQKAGSLKGIDYSKIKVTKGNSKKISSQEYYMSALEKINSQIDEIKHKVKKEYDFIQTRIKFVKKWNYRKLLALRYLEGQKWTDIIEEFFSLEDDYDEEKQNKYKDKIMYWNRQALNELKRVNAASD